MGQGFLCPVRFLPTLTYPTFSLPPSDLTEGLREGCLGPDVDGLLLQSLPAERHEASHLERLVLRLGEVAARGGPGTPG